VSAVRDLWEQTDRRSPEFRFHNVIKLLQAAPEKPVRHKPVGDDIRRKVADGASGTISTSLPTRSKRIVTMFRGRSIAMCREESFHCKAERKRVGIGYA